MNEDGAMIAGRLAGGGAVLGRGLLIAVGLPFLLSRVWMGAFVYLAHAGRPFLGEVPGGWIGVDHWWLNPWMTFDSRWFLQIATDGYEPFLAPFFPLYPMLLRLAGPGEGAMALWGVCISNIALGVSGWLMYRLSRVEQGETVARLAVWTLMFYPSTAFFSACYTDSLFLMLLLASLLLMRHGLPWTAALVGGLAALTRNPGFLITFMLALDYAQARRFDWRRIRMGELVPCLIPLVCFVLFQMWLAVSFESWHVGASTHAQYYRGFSWPWQPLVLDLARTLGGAISLNPLLSVVATIGALSLVLLVGRRAPLSYSFFTVGILVLHFCVARTIPPYSVPAARYLGATPFPQLIALVVARSGRAGRLGFFVVYALACAIESYAFGMKNSIG